MNATPDVAHNLKHANVDQNESYHFRKSQSPTDYLSAGQRDGSERRVQSVL